MGRASRADAAEHRDEIVAATSRLLRERGAGAVSVNDAMSAAGLTHGGFYKHFASKDELMGLAAAAAFDQRIAGMQRILEEHPERDDATTQMLDRYLSVDHRDAPGTGCGNTAIAADSARAPGDSPLHTAYTAGLRATVEELADYQPEDLDEQERRDRAILQLATMVGALTLARGTAGDPISEEILSVTREALLAQR